jgi:hypothetical protein
MKMTRDISLRFVVPVVLGVIFGVFIADAFWWEGAGSGLKGVLPKALSLA